MTAAYKLSLATFFAVLALLACASFASAASVQWNYIQPDYLCSPLTLHAAAGTYFSSATTYATDFYVDGDYAGMWGSASSQSFVNNCVIQVSDVNFSVTYHAEITDSNTGEVIAPGATVAKGARLHLRFIPHVFEDISWFGTGASLDSPFGEWVKDAAPPGPIACRQQDYLNAWYGDGYHEGDFYAALTLDPPSKSFKGLDNLDCTVNGTEADCTMNSVGMFPIGFDFAPTIGNLYGRFGAPDGTTIDLSPVNPVIHGTGCFGSNVPMRYFRDRGWASNGAEVPNLPKGDVWNLQVPEQVIDYPITVSTSAAQAPTPPGIIRGACTVGTPYSISFTSTDPNGRQLKYGIDWDNDGTVDQWVPPSAYVDSGTRPCGRIAQSIG